MSCNRLSDVFVPGQHTFSNNGGGVFIEGFVCLPLSYIVN